ncbi:hypothetical protein HanIR_Chr05g0230851 [Helianthus annuus]|nr:hypothetical protein HanIR_Chr05g0230851 [Helianthus annuus]
MAVKKNNFFNFISKFPLANRILKLHVIQKCDSIVLSSQFHLQFFFSSKFCVENCASKLFVILI